MAYKEIPEGAVEIQTGLYWYVVERVISGITRRFGYLYSAPGYCFYETTQPENYDEEGNLLPPEQRVYATYASVPVTADLSVFVSVPVEEGYEIVSAGSNTQTS